MAVAGAPAAPEGGGGGVADALVALDQQLFRVVSAVQKAQVPDDVKQAFSQALDAFRSGLEALTGGGASSQPQSAGAATPEQGANPNARPMNHGGF